MTETSAETPEPSLTDTVTPPVEPGPPPPEAAPAATPVTSRVAPPDPVVAEIVRRELTTIGRVRQHLPPNFDELPMPIRNRLYQQVEEALAPEPDLGWIRGAEFLEPPRDTDWLIQNLITAASDGGRVLVAGPEKSFKSLFASGCLVAIASGRPLFGYERWQVKESGDVLAFMGEGGREWNRSRIVRLMEGLRYSDEEKNRTVDRIWMATVPLTPPERFALKLEETLKSRKWKLVIVDSLYVFGGTTERSQLAAMGTLLVRWAELCERAGATLMVVDHFKKATTALELASVSGVGASQWAQAWALMKAKYDHDSDTTVMNVKTGARQSAGGIYRVTIGGVMNGAITISSAEVTEDPDEDEDALDDSAVKAEAVFKFNRYCADRPGEWVRLSQLKNNILRTSEMTIVNHVLSQPNVAIAESRTGSQQWVFAVDETGAVPEELPKNAAGIVREPVLPTADETDETDETDAAAVEQLEAEGTA